MNYPWAGGYFAMRHGCYFDSGGGTLARWLPVLVVGFASAIVPDTRAGAGQPTLLGWNNLGMHCMDDDYSLFSILPPFNTIDAQLIDGAGHLVTAQAGYTLTYEALPGPTGSITTTASGKSNFWAYAPALFGATLPVDKGLAGFAMPGSSNTPQALVWMAGGIADTWEATGVPVAPSDDAGARNSYPLFRIVARDAGGTEIAHADVVAPVSDEMDCRTCHTSGGAAAARPAAGWAGDPRPGRDYRLNILQLHDEHHLGEAVYDAALATVGYSSAGLRATAEAGQPILCAACHASEALGTGGAAGVPPLTRSMHAGHSQVVSPVMGLILDAVANRSACYQCHPGSATQCLRGAMGSAVDAGTGLRAMQCQSCHGTMSQVGAVGRTGWLDEPNCQACHTGTATTNAGQIRFTSALLADGSLRTPADPLFATTADTPAAGLSLYRFSAGHGGLQCSACHGSTHVVFPSIHAEDNLYAEGHQGHAGVISDCLACHATMPSTVTGGPHGMHPIGDTWVRDHHDHYSSACKACHGTDLKGTVLSRALGPRTLSLGSELGGTRTLWRGQTVGCYECHNGSGSDNATPYSAPTLATTLVLPATERTVATSATVVPSPAAGVTLRVVKQPTHGTVAVQGFVFTYRPDPGYVGSDAFSYAATNGYRESALGTATVDVGLSTPAGAPAGDGVADLIKYALGLDPSIPAPVAELPVVRVETVDGVPYLTLSAPRNPLATGITCIVEASDDLVTWTPLDDPALLLADRPSYWKVRDALPAPASGSTSARFLRLRVETK